MGRFYSASDYGKWENSSDFKVTVNKFSKVRKYCLETSQCCFCFTSMDLKQENFQLHIEEKSQILLTIKTLKSILRFLNYLSLLQVHVIFDKGNLYSLYMEIVTLQFLLMIFVLQMKLFKCI